MFLALKAVKAAQSRKPGVSANGSTAAHTMSEREGLPQLWDLGEAVDRMNSMARQTGASVELCREDGSGNPVPASVSPQSPPCHPQPSCGMLICAKTPLFAGRRQTCGEQAPQCESPTLPNMSLSSTTRAKWSGFDDVRSSEMRISRASAFARRQTCTWRRFSG
jgi:hypothetical protein